VTPEQFRRVDELFNAVRALPAPQRAAYLTSACADDSTVRGEVEALLAHDEQPEHYLKTPALGAPLRMITRGAPRAAPGATPLPARIGAYRVLRVLGEGGFGVVYLAEQENPRRTVAVKVLKAHIATPQSLKRFEYEAQVLGRLQHPGIAQIYEAGVADLEYTAPRVPPAGAAGRRDDAPSLPLDVGPLGVHRQAFFAMEFVPGLPLHEYAQKRRLELRTRLELLAAVCDAVQYAHQKGVIHRDLKPANILVTDDDAAGAGPDSPRSGRATRAAAPKILDFGVARTSDPELTLTTLRTSAGQLVGTLPYMSPEQVAGDPDEVDTRSDVYSLGVILYQLLAERLPLDLRSCSMPEAARRIRDDAPPRLGTLDRAFRGEIETIAAKALEKNRARRYQSAAELATDIRRYLAGEPIEAKRDSAMYVLRKQLNRYRHVLVGGALGVLALIVFATYAVVLAGREFEAKQEALLALDKAQISERRADQAAALARAELRISDVERGRLLGLNGNTRAAEALLWPQHLHSPDSYHTRWALWELYSHQPCVATLKLHDGRILVIADAPDGSFFATGGEDGLIKLWNPDTFELLAALGGDGGPVHALAFDPAGRRIAGVNRNRVHIWDVGSCEPRVTLTPSKTDVRALAFSPDGKVLATGQAEPEIELWDVASGAPLGKLTGHTRRVNVLRFTADGTLLSAAGDWTTRAWFGLDGASAVLARHEGDVGGLAVSPDGRFAASGGNDRLTKLFDLNTLAFVRDLAAPNGFVRLLAYSRDGRTLAQGGWWYVLFWDMTSTDPPRRVSVPEGISAMSYIAGDRYLAAGFSAGMLKVWEPEPGDRRYLAGHDGRCAASYSPDGRLIATGDSAGAVHLWEARTGRPLAALRAHAARVRSLRFHPHEPLLVTDGEDAVLRVWDLRTGACIDRKSPIVPLSSLSCDISPDGRYLAYACREWTHEVLDLEQGRVVTQLRSSRAEPVSVRFAPDSRILTTIARDGLIRFWTIPEGIELKPIPESTQAWTAAFSSDGRWLYVGNWGRQLLICDAVAGRTDAALDGHLGLISDVAVRPGDERVVATAAADGTVKLWDVQGRHALLTLTPFDGWDAITVEFSPDGRMLLTGGADGRVCIYDLTYFERHMAGNLESQIGELPPEQRDMPGVATAREWARRVRQDPSPPPLTVWPAGPETIASWGLAGAHRASAN
jgi:WD40 repeat protein/serine/threonine protein kinase